MAQLIGRIALDPPVVRPGETLRVEVLDPTDKPLQSASVTVNGVQGGLQFLQFPTAGKRRISVRAANGSGAVESQVALVDVAGTRLEFPSIEGKKDIAMIGVTQSPTHPYTALLTVGSYIDNRSPHLLGLAPAVSVQPGRIFESGSRIGKLIQGGTVGRLLSENAHRLTKIETRRLTNTKRTAARRARRSSRLAVSAVYDLTGIEVGRVPNVVLPEYEWDFGDGRKQTTRSPQVSHDYFPSIDHSRDYGQFVVTCRIKHANITVSRTLTIGSAYALCKRTGTVTPHVVADLFAHKRFTMITGTFTVYNVEDQPMVLDRLSITPNTDDGDALALPKPFVKLDEPVTIGKKSKTVITVNVPFVGGNVTPKDGELRHDVTGFTALYAGKVGKYPVRCTAVFDIPMEERQHKPKFPFGPELPPLTRKPWPWELVENILDKVVLPVLDPIDHVSRRVTLDRVTGTLAIAAGAIADVRSLASVRREMSNVLSAVFAPVEALAVQSRMAKPATSRVRSAIGTLSRLGRLLRIPKLPSGAEELPGIVMQTHKGPPLPGPIAEGQVCDPDNLTEADLDEAFDAQLVCQLTSETEDVLMPARWMNARKGDIILSPGGSGLIAGLMQQVSPPQWYSHCGIMTRNYDEIAHSTGSESRLRDHPVGVADEPTDGFEPNVLKFMWPGAVRQSVEASVHGEPYPDPEFDATYSISSFGPHMVGVTHNDQMKMIPPLVIKPDPMLETAAVRTALHAIATDAASAAARPGDKPDFHYRWFTYTDPKIGLGPAEGSGAGWAEGTRGSCCSSFIWLHAKKHGAALETNQTLVTPTDLEPNDVATGAAVRPVTPDGLYTYSAEERLKAGEWLYDTIYNQGFEAAGWFFNGLTDTADDVASQFLNAFANDDGDGKDSDAWRQVTTADAVSPDDLLWWDGPSTGGLYGYVEPALYREPRTETYTVSRWKKVLNRGTVRGQVRANGAAAGGALVQVYAGKSTFSQGDGSYTLPDVPLGLYFLKASKVIDGVLHSAQRSVDVKAADQVIDLDLLPPADRFRIAQITIDFNGTDEEITANEMHDPGPEYFELELGPDKLINSAHRTYKWGGEVRVEYDITVRLLVNNTIDVAVQGTLFEGTSESTKDLDGTGSMTFQVPVGQTSGSTLTITNTDEEDGDAGVLSMTVKNVVNNN